MVKKQTPFVDSQRAFHSAVKIMDKAFGRDGHPALKQYQKMTPEDLAKMTSEQGLTGTIDYIRRLASLKMMESG